MKFKSLCVSVEVGVITAVFGKLFLFIDEERDEQTYKDELCASIWGREKKKRGNMKEGNGIGSEELAKGKGSIAKGS